MSDLPKILIKGAEPACEQLHAAIVALGQFEGSGKIQVRDGMSGRSLEKAGDDTRMVRLLGTTSPYDASEVYAVPGGAWVNSPGTPTIAPCFEENNLPGLAGAVVEIHRGYRNDWRFEFIRAKERAATLATVCASVALCDGSGEILILTFNGPGGFTATCTTVLALKSATCCVMVPATGTYCVTTGGQTHCVNVTGAGTFFVGGFCLDAGDGTKSTVCVNVVDCIGLGRPGVTVTWPDASMSTTDSNGNACSCQAHGTGTVTAPVAGYVDHTFTVPSGLTPCSSHNLFPVINLADMLDAGYKCPSCSPTGDLRTPYKPGINLTDSVCGGATLTAFNTWELRNPLVGTCVHMHYFLGCSGPNTLTMTVTAPDDILAGFGQAAIGAWTQGGAFAATFHVPSFTGPGAFAVYPARTVTVTS